MHRHHFAVLQFLSRRVYFVAICAVILSLEAYRQLASGSSSARSENFISNKTRSGTREFSFKWGIGKSVCEKLEHLTYSLRFASTLSKRMSWWWTARA